MPTWLIVAFVLFSVTELSAIASMNKKQKKQGAKASLTSFICYALIFLAVWAFSLWVPSYVLLLSMVAIFINCIFGYYLDWFNRSKVFDRYLHAYGTLSFTLLAYCLIRNLFETGGSRAFLSLFTFTTGMALGAVFELIEAAADAKNGTNNQRGLQDTNMDILGDLIGSLVAAAIVYLYLT